MARWGLGLCDSQANRKEITAGLKLVASRITVMAHGVEDPELLMFAGLARRVVGNHQRWQEEIWSGRPGSYAMLKLFYVWISLPLLLSSFVELMSNIGDVRPSLGSSLVKRRKCADSSLST
ncbi:hypothetical protein ACJRO7_027738 [Eucalyptus globulus]|uniref:Uncharacterized protein n=1 Tax=Eucalyptus globulus TaxID=34317 RepID=A0ABD3K501_EUCGL